MDAVGGPANSFDRGGFRERAGFHVERVEQPRSPADRGRSAADRRRSCPGRRPTMTDAEQSSADPATGEGEPSLLEEDIAPSFVARAFPWILMVGAWIVIGIGIALGLKK